MTETCTKHHPQVRTVSGEVLSPTPPRINLSSAETIRQEMARVYREARSGQIDTNEASKLIYMLSQITKAYELGEIEKRLAELEQATQQRRLT